MRWTLTVLVFVAPAALFHVARPIICAALFANFSASVMFGFKRLPCPFMTGSARLHNFFAQ
jgi:hypothetical protein